MRARGRTNRSLAAGAGVAKSTVSNLAAGLRPTLTDRAARSLARELAVPVDVVFPLDGAVDAPEVRTAAVELAAHLAALEVGLSTASINSGGRPAARRSRKPAA